MKNNFKFLFVFGLVVFSYNQAFAKDMTGQNPTSDDIVNALSPSQSQPKANNFKFRAIRPTKNVTSTVGKEKEQEEKPSIDLTINFASGSALISDDSKKTLEVLGKALNSEKLKDFTFMVIGHTDSIGNAGYNQRLSEKRAKSVKKHLVSHYDVSEGKIAILGKGETELLDKKNPKSWKNRRVEILNLGKRK